MAVTIHYPDGCVGPPGSDGRQTVTTAAFVRELHKFNWHWTPRQANQWIETYVTVFRDVSPNEGENRTFQLFNPNGGR